MSFGDVIDDSQVKKYFFPLENIPRLSCDDPLVETLISEEKPVVITDTNLCNSALKWNARYLSDNLSGSLSVYSSPNKFFKYFDDSKAQQNAPCFTPPVKRFEMTSKRFLQALQEWKPGDNRLYLQQPLNNTAGLTIARDFLQFDWPWLKAYQKKFNWGQLTSNLLLVGMEGNVTPVHYDEQHNFFSQLVGFKRCILFPPENYENLYPYPVYHPHDRQSQVDFDNPDCIKFPKLKKLAGQEAILGPGDVLYIPIYWWHHIENLTSLPQTAHAEDEAGIRHTVSLNFWYKGGVQQNIEYPLLSRQKLAIIRNIEKMLLETLKDPAELGPLLRALVVGRYMSEENQKEKI